MSAVDETYSRRPDPDDLYANGGQFTPGGGFTYVGREYGWDDPEQDLQTPARPDTWTDHLTELVAAFPDGFTAPDIRRWQENRQTTQPGRPRIETIRATTETGPNLVDRLRAALVDTAGLDTIGEPVPIVHQVLYKDSLAWLFGKPGCGKSFVALDIAASVATGTTWQGCPVRQGPVLYLVAEGISGLRGRVRAWEQAATTPMTGVQFLPIAVQTTNAAMWTALCDLAGQLGAELVVLDTQARITSGLDENSARDMGTLVDRAEQLRKATGAAVLLVHHQGRAGEHMRGSTALEGAATTIIQAEKRDDEVTLSCAKQKDAAEFDTITLRLIPTGTSAIVSLTDGLSQPKIETLAGLSFIRLWRDRLETEAVSVSQLVDAEIVTKATFYRYILPLVKAGLAEKIGGGRTTRYRLLGIHDE